MATIRPRPRPGPEAIAWNGTNDDELLKLAQRVADLDIWAPLHGDITLSCYVVDRNELHPGLNIARQDGVVVARVEEGNYLVFDPFAVTPLQVMLSEHFAAFYETGD